MATNRKRAVCGIGRVLLLESVPCAPFDRGGDRINFTDCPRRKDELELTRYLTSEWSSVETIL